MNLEEAQAFEKGSWKDEYDRRKEIDIMEDVGLSVSEKKGL